MAFKDSRKWIGKIEEIGKLKRVTAEVDWNLELSIRFEILVYSSMSYRVQ